MNYKRSIVVIAIGGVWITSIAFAQTIVPDWAPDGSSISVSASSAAEFSSAVSSKLQGTGTCFGGTPTFIFTQNSCYSSDGLYTLSLLDGSLNVLGSYQFSVLNGAALDAFDTSTRIISTTPYAYQTVATGTQTVSATVYVSNEDSHKGVWVELFASRNQDSAPNIGVQIPVRFVYAQQIYYTGMHTISTTTSFDATGAYTLETSIRLPGMGSWLTNLAGLGDILSVVLDSTSTPFTVDHLSAWDIFNQTQQKVIAGLQASSTPDLSSCSSLLQFNMLSCLVNIFAFDPTFAGMKAKEFIGVFAQTAPLGYLTRAVSLISASTTATSTDLVIGMTFPDDSNVWHDFSGSSFSINLSDIIRQSDTLLRTPFPMPNGIADKNFWDLIMPILDVLAAVMCLYYVIHRLTGFRNEYRSTMGGKYLGKGITDDSFRYKQHL